MSEAGSDTTRNQLNIFIAAMAGCPVFIETARAQLDAVCGTGDNIRLPTFDDWDNLPYIRATVKENLRWRQNLPQIGMPHSLIEDDEYEGYKFPKGTVFVTNSWGICTNPDEYEDPLAFKPERFLDADMDNAVKGIPTFGVHTNVRLCPGWHVGVRNMFIVFARLLYCFDVIEDPEHRIDNMDINPFAHDKSPYNENAKFEIRPRGPQYAALVERECKDAAQVQFSG